MPGPRTTSYGPAFARDLRGELQIRALLGASECPLQESKAQRLSMKSHMGEERHAKLYDGPPRRSLDQACETTNESTGIGIGLERRTTGSIIMKEVKSRTVKTREVEKVG